MALKLRKRPGFYVTGEGQSKPALVDRKGAKKSAAATGCAESTKGGGWRRHTLDAWRHLESNGSWQMFAATQNRITNI
jgi:hypothetical protein